MGPARAVLLLALLFAPLGPGATPTPAAPDSVQRAYEFIYSTMDSSGVGTAPGLPRSYVGGTLEKDGYTSSTTYDDALVIDALLVRGTPEDVRRASDIGTALREAQQRDPAGDGRLRASYASGPLPAQGPVPATNNSSDTGAMAWAGHALLNLYQKTQDKSYLDSSVALGNWLQHNSADQRGAGGYTGGQDGDDQPLRWKSTEQNLDLVSFFAALGRVTGDPAWADRSGHARRFAESMYDPDGPRFWTGTDTDGVTVNKHFIPSDTQTWSYLALLDPRYAGTLDYATTAMAAHDGPFEGISTTADERSAVWFEGTAHLADALRLRNGPGDADHARRLLDSITLAQTQAPNNDGHGIVAASHDTPVNAQGVRQYASPHMGTTAWYVMAMAGHNPFA